MIAFVVLTAIALLWLGYIFYGKFISKKFSLDDTRSTPACEINDGQDYVPAKSSLLLGQHFSAIAAAGPIVGPILGGLWFGWLPTFIWIILGSIFIGGVHDFASLVASIRHKAVSIGEVVKQYMSPFSHILFLIFIWLALDYLIIAFTDITAQTFKTVTSGSAHGPGVAAASFLYLLLAVVMGFLLYRFKTNLKLTTIISLIVLMAIILYCTNLPQSLSDVLAGIPVKSWDIILLVYCFIASLLPMWLLLQPRGYLGGWFLYITIAVSLIGSLFGGFNIQYPAFNLSGLESLTNMKMVFPILFITVACGACSGFHGIVSSGTTSKQLQKESDAKVIGYGAMLLEGLVAVLALATVMMLAKGDSGLNDDPNLIYAKGIASYLKMIGVDYNLALSFALLAFSTFVYDSLDVCTRLGRYVLQELIGWKSKTGAYAATFLTLILPVIFLLATEEKGYLAAWAVFGTSNQLLATLVLLAIAVWLKKTGRRAMFAIIPMIFMLTMTMWSLVLLITPFLKGIAGGNAMNAPVIISGISGIVLFIMSLYIIGEAFTILIWKEKSKVEVKVQET